MLKDIKIKLENYLGDCELSLSCEILLSCKNLEELLQIDTDLLHEMNRQLQLLKTSYPFILLKKKSGLNEFGISLFAHQARFSDNNFLDTFQVFLATFLQVVLQEQKLNAKINAFGKYRNLNNDYDFRYINNLEDVKYKIVEEIPRKITINRKYRIAGASLAVFLFIAWHLYERLNNVSIVEILQQAWWQFTNWLYGIG